MEYYVDEYVRFQYIPEDFMLKDLNKKIISDKQYNNQKLRDYVDVINNVYSYNFNNSIYDK